VRTLSICRQVNVSNPDCLGINGKCQDVNLVCPVRARRGGAGLFYVLTDVTRAAQFSYVSNRCAQGGNVRCCPRYAPAAVDKYIQPGKPLDTTSCQVRLRACACVGVVIACVGRALPAR
jgi:hypothetical protein